MGASFPVYDAMFEDAVTRWESIIINDLQDYGAQGLTFDWFGGQFSSGYNGPVDDVVIGYEIGYIDGPGKHLGFAGPSYVRPGSTSTISGIMKFEEADLNNFDTGDVETIILHEMGKSATSLCISAADLPKCLGAPSIKPCARNIPPNSPSVILLCLFHCPFPIRPRARSGIDSWILYIYTRCTVSLLWCPSRVQRHPWLRRQHPQFLQYSPLG